jgi:hypothetical protein
MERMHARKQPTSPKGLTACIGQLLPAGATHKVSSKLTSLGRVDGRMKTPCSARNAGAAPVEPRRRHQLPHRG